MGALSTDNNQSFRDPSLRPMIQQHCAAFQRGPACWSDTLGDTCSSSHNTMLQLAIGEKWPIDGAVLQTAKYICVCCTKP